MDKKAKAIERLTNIRDRMHTELDGVLEARSPKFQKWKTDAAVAVRRVFGEQSVEHKAFGEIRYTPSAPIAGGGEQHRQ